MLGLALAGEIAVPELTPGMVLTVNGDVIDGTEARGLPGGAHLLHVLASDGRLVFRRRVLLGDDERVELDPEQSMSPEVFRGPAPERSAEEAAETGPQLLVVGAVEWQRVRLHLDGEPMELDPDTRTFRRRLAAGEHRLERLVAGRPRPPVAITVSGSPWQCAVARDGAMDCVELLDPPPTWADPDAVDDALRAMAVDDRLDWLLAMDARMRCSDVATFMDELYGDEAKVKLALGVRQRVADPWNHEVLTRELTFPEGKRRVVALYGGQAQVRAPEASGAPDPRPAMKELPD